MSAKATAATAAPTESREPAPGAARYLNRELSLLQYAERVLARAENTALPVLERVLFLHFFAIALDDFFQIRVAGLKEQLDAAPALASPDGLRPDEQLREIRVRVGILVERQTQLWRDELMPGLAAAGIRVVDASGLPEEDLEWLSADFRRRVFPVLTPLAVDPSHPFPYISHFSLNLAVMVRDPLRREQRFARLKVPPLLPRFVALPDGARFVPLEQVIAANLQLLFPGMEVLGHSVFRVTRDNDLDVRDSEADDLLVTIQTELLRQRRRARSVRLEVTPDMSDENRHWLTDELELQPDDVYEIEGLLDLGSTDFFCDLERPELKLRRYVQETPARLAGVDSGTPDIFAVLREGDLLVHHPYESFATTVVAFIQQAAADPSVLAIKQTLYRTSESSPIAVALTRAAEEGKQVVAMVELKARGDEQANIDWARKLEESGVHVVYGLVGFKTHAKLMLVVRSEVDGIRRYCHVGTGNYNPNTARAYEDLGLMTCDDEIGADVSETFNFLTGYSRQRRFRKLLVAPVSLRPGLTQLIKEEADQPDGRIVFKINNLTDQGIIDALLDAAARGAEIDLIVRGMCCLRPGVEGLSERIRVRSLVGHFLQHSRIFSFGSESRGTRYFIGSADMMDRNLDRRVEAVAPVLDPELKSELADILDVELRDDTLAWELLSDGSWRRVPKGDGVDTHEHFMRLAHERAQVVAAGLG
ncbi:MAG: polyphosphate kinase 1 [Candidatus Dormibacteraeota bacterium]|nr:polyphosphate kinase 1 [Candidatus Dormibacteraeota bacterium]